MPLNSIAKTFQQAEEAVRDHCDLSGHEPYERDRLLQELRKLRRGDFRLDGDVLFDLWDAIGLWQRDEDLEKLYTTLDVILYLRQMAEDAPEEPFDPERN